MQWASVRWHEEHHLDSFDYLHKKMIPTSPKAGPRAPLREQSKPPTIAGRIMDMALVTGPSWKLQPYILCM